MGRGGGRIHLCFLLKLLCLSRVCVSIVEGERGREDLTLSSHFPPISFCLFVSVSAIAPAISRGDPATRQPTGQRASMAGGGGGQGVGGGVGRGGGWAGGG